MKTIKKYVSILIAITLLFSLSVTSYATGMNVRIQGDRLYWKPSDVSHSYYNVYSNGNLTSPAHEWNGTEYERYIGGLPNGAKIMVCAMVNQSQVDCETVTYNKGGDGGDPQTYTVTTGLNGDILTWDVEPKAGAYQVSIKKDNQHKATMGLSGQVDLSQFGSGAYKVEVEAMDGKVLGISETVNYTSGGNDPPPQGNVTASLNGSVLTWNIDPSIDYDRVRIYKDGQYILDTTRSDVDLCDRGSGNYYVVPVDGRVSPAIIHSSSNTVYFGGCSGTDPDPVDPLDPPEVGCTDCQKLIDILECPGWSLMMGDITQAISRALPPPPDWNYVASVMTNHIVPAMTSDLVNVVVPAMGNEIDRRLGQAHYDGNTGVTTPSFSTPWQTKENVPVMRDLDRTVDFNLSDQSQIPVFEVEDMTETVSIPDPLGWENPATEDRPVPKFKTESRETVPSGEVGELEPRQTKPSELGGNEDPQPRPTTPTNDPPDRNDPLPKPTTPTDGGTAAPRPTTPSNGGSQPTDPSTGNPRGTIPTDWKKGG